MGPYYSTVSWLYFRRIDRWPEYIVNWFYYRRLKSLIDNASPRNTNNAHVSRTTTRTPKISSPICSPCLCGHVKISIVVLEHSTVYSFPTTHQFMRQIIFPSVRSNALWGGLRHTLSPFYIAESSPNVEFYPLSRWNQLEECGCRACHTHT